jgi:hypothetical protein
MGSFDINFMESLVAAGIPRPHAQVLTEQLRVEIDGRIALSVQNLATTRDLKELEVRLIQEHSKTQDRISQSNERIAETHTRIAETKTETLKWTLGFMVAQTGILFAAIKFAG